ncbi:MAG: TM0106 family RecB-like putative nuclease [Pseudomonadota bacterium]
MPINASVLYDHVTCPQRVALDAFEDISLRDEINPFVKLLWEKGSLFERETVAKLSQSFLDLSSFEDDEKERQTLEAVKRGEPLIYAGRISSGDLIGLPTLLRKEGNGYAPGIIKSGAGEEGASDDDDGKPKVHYAVQLALYIDVLERLGVSSGRHGFIWDIHENEVMYDFTQPRGPRTPGTLWDKYQEVLAGARAILIKDFIPQPAYASGACKLCHWYTNCLKQLTDSDDLTLIPFLGRSIRDVMQPIIATIAVFAASDPESFINGKKTSFPGLGPDRLRQFHARAVLLKHPRPTPYLRGPITLGSASLELFFDIEVDPMRDICYLHGIVERRNGDNNSERFISFFAEEETAQAERAAFAQAFAYLTAHSDCVIYYYSKYERTIYRKLQAKYPDVCNGEDIERLFDPARSIDLYFDVVFPATEWPTNDHSLKTLAKHLGFGWRDTHPSGAASIEWYDRWCKERDIKIKQRILEYNEDDCRATRVLLDGVRSLAHLQATAA